MKKMPNCQNCGIEISELKHDLNDGLCDLCHDDLDIHDSLDTDLLLWEE